MISVFHLLQWMGTFLGVSVGIFAGHHWFGWIGGTVGAVVGFYVGGMAGRLPFAITTVLLKRDLDKCDVATLRSRLENEPYIAHLIISHLLIRGEPVESFQGYVSKLLTSDCPERRRCGEHILRIWPETGNPAGCLKV